MKITIQIAPNVRMYKYYGQASMESNYKTFHQRENVGGCGWGGVVVVGCRVGGGGATEVCPGGGYIDGEKAEGR